jgi:hypothetical protein
MEPQSFKRTLQFFLLLYAQYAVYPRMLSVYFLLQSPCGVGTPAAWWFVANCIVY